MYQDSILNGDIMQIAKVLEKYYLNLVIEDPLRVTVNVEFG